MDHRQVEFLDVTLIDEGDKISSKLCRKPSAGNSPLRADLGHPKHTIRGIPVSQFLRLRRVFSNESDFQMETSNMKLRFMDRGYAESVLDRAFTIASNVERGNFLQDGTVRSKNGGRHLSRYGKSVNIPVFPTPYSSVFNKIKKYY